MLFREGHRQRVLAIVGSPFEQVMDRRDGASQGYEAQGPAAIGSDLDGKIQGQESCPWLPEALWR